MTERRDPDEIWPHYTHTYRTGSRVKVWCPFFTDPNREPIARSVDGQCVHLRADIEALGWRKADFDNHQKKGG